MQPFRLRALALIAALLPVAAVAEPDTFGLGTGRDGAKTVSAPDTEINVYAALTQHVGAGGKTLRVGSTTGFGAGDLVLVIQMNDAGYLPESGVQTMLDLRAGGVGRWELGRVASATATELVLTAPLESRFDGPGSQVVRVPEYTTLTVQPAGRITAPEWDGATGGLVAALVQGAVLNHGAIDVSGLGFRGGLEVPDPGASTGCVPGQFDEPGPAGAQKGEGIAPELFGPSHTGRGNVANGGGGGACLKAGGGGGGGAGQGGGGGRAAASGGAAAVGGLGGAALSFDPLTRLVMGGGGGAGHAVDGDPSYGGRGGGLVFLRAQSLGGPGAILAEGKAGGSGNSDGAGGGGAGGTVYLRVAGAAECGALSFSGGDGGHVVALSGPGGGGASGIGLFQSASGACRHRAQMDGGLAGLAGTTDATARGALDGDAGLIIVPPGGFPLLTPPTLDSPAAGARLSTPRPQLVGRAQARVMVVVLSGGVEVGRDVADDQGRFSIQPSMPLGEGVASLVLYTEQQAVQSTRTAPTQIHVDLTPPGAPEITRPSDGARLPTGAFEIAGRAEAGATVTVRAGLGVLGQVTARPDGTWSFTIAANDALRDGAYELSATAVDSAGNISQTSEVVVVVVDTTPPDTFFAIAPRAFDNNTRPSFALRSDDLFDTITFECRLDDEPDFRPCESTFQLDALPEGGHELQARAVDSAGNRDPTPARHFWTIDLTPPDAARIVSPAEGAFVRTRQPLLQGTADAGGRVELTVDGVHHGVAPVDHEGGWSFLPGVLVEGIHLVEAVAYDAAGNQGPPVTRGFTIDTVPPETYPEAFPDPLTRSRTATFRFVSNEESATFECRVDDGLFVACASPETYENLAEGDHVFEVRAVDLAGNTDPTPAIWYWSVDVTAPGRPVVLSPADGSVIADPRPQLDGTAEANTTVVLLQGDEEPAATFSDADGAWTLHVPLTLQDGPNTLRLLARDAAGNESDVLELSLFVDTLRPNTTLTTTVAAISNSPRAEFEPGSNEQNVRFECSLNGAAFETCPSPLVLDGLTERQHVLRVRARDRAGNVDATPAEHRWTVDLTAPVPPVFDQPAHDALVADAQPRLAGAAEPMSTVRIFLAGEPVAQLEAGSDGRFQWRPGEPLEDGAHAFVATAADQAGNTSAPSAPHRVRIDTVAPTTTIVAAPEALTGLTRASFSFEADEAPVTFECSLNDAPFAPCAAQDAEFDQLGERQHVLRVRAVDAAGNRDPEPAEHRWVVDLTPPLAPVLLVPQALGYVANPLPEFAGTAEAGSTLELFIDGAKVGTTVVASDGTWSLAPGSPLVDGAYKATARAIDLLGRAGELSAPVAFAVDTVAPDTGIESGPEPLVASSRATFVLTSNEDGVSFECRLDQSAWAACAATAVFPGLSDGAHSLEARAKDRAGNVDLDPVSYGWSIDTVPPPAPWVKSPEAYTTTSNPRPTFAGTSEPGSTVTVFVDGGELLTAQANEAGAWSSESPRDFTGGAYNVTAIARDAAGNFSPQSPMFPFGIDLSEPETTINSGPFGHVPRPTATFSFSSPDQNARFECRLDGGEWEACASPTHLDGLADGQHTFEVRAINRAGNIDSTPASRTWTVVTPTPPPPPPPPTPVDDKKGCGCSSDPGSALFALLGVGALGLRCRRR